MNNRKDEPVSDEKIASQLMADPMWRLSHFYKIKTKDRDLITFVPNRAQEHYLQNKTLRDIILKARQLGFSTLKLLEILDFTLANKNVNSAIIAHQRDKTAILFEIIRLAYTNMHPAIKPNVSYDNRNELYFPDMNSKIVVALDTRGETTHDLHVSELAYVEDATNRMLGVLESVPKDAPISFESTANGVGGYFNETWDDPKSEFKKHFYNWTWDDEYVDDTTKSMDELKEEYHPIATRHGLILDIADRFELTPEQFQWYINKAIRHRGNVVQEYPTTALEAFISTGRNVFAMVDLQKHIPKKPIGRKYQDFLYWEEPQERFKYVIGCDPSEGVGGDNSVICVLNAHTGEQVGEFATNRCPPDILAGYLMDIGKWYNNAYLVVEINSIGAAVMQEIKQKYSNVYRRETFDKISNSWTPTLGWRTTSGTKAILVEELERRVREESILVNSEDTLKEMKTFVRSDAVGTEGYGAEGSNKDDRVVAMGLAVQGLKNIPYLKPEQANTKTIAQIKMEEYLKRHSMPEEFRSLDHRNRPQSGLRRRE